MDEVTETTSLRFGFSNPAYSDIANALVFLRRVSGEETAFGFKDRLDSVIDALCERIPQEIAASGKPFDAPDEPASLHYAMPVYKERLETSRKRKRGSSSGLWYVYYKLLGQSATSGAHMLVVVRIRHSASEPFTVTRTDDEPDES